MKFKFYLVITCFQLLMSCSSLLKYDKASGKFKHEEFDNKVKIVEAVEPDSAKTIENPVRLVSPPASVPVIQKNIAVKAKKKIKTNNPVVSIKRQPEIEDDEGFDNKRRPLNDPFRPGEKITHDVSYLGASAGTLSLSVKPFAKVNERKNYNFFIDLKSNSFFSRIFAIDDQVQTYMDFENLVPVVFKLDIRDSGQVKEAKSYFDFDNLKASYWEHKFTEKSGHEEKKTNWTILPFSQNAFSAIFYMRVFKWNIGKEYTFRVADDEKNIIFRAKALEKTKLSTEAGDFEAIKIKAEVVTRGNLAKASDFYIWLSDDNRKYVLRIEVSLPVGSVVSEVIDINEGI